MWWFAAVFEYISMLVKTILIYKQIYNLTTIISRLFFKYMARFLFNYYAKVKRIKDPFYISDFCYKLPHLFLKEVWGLIEVTFKNKEWLVSPSGLINCSLVKMTPIKNCQKAFSTQQLQALPVSSKLKICDFIISHKTHCQSVCQVSGTSTFLLQWLMKSSRCIWQKTVFSSLSTVNVKCCSLSLSLTTYCI